MAFVKYKRLAQFPARSLGFREHKIRVLKRAFFLGVRVRPAGILGTTSERSFEPVVENPGARLQEVAPFFLVHWGIAKDCWKKRT